MAKDDIDEILLELKKDVLRAVDGRVGNKIKQVYKEETEQSYDMYSPKNSHTSRYRDGHSGSFADENNFQEEIKLTNGGVEYTLRNHRQTDCNCAYCRSKNPYLDTYIENGIAGKYLVTPKKTYERTQDRLESENIVENELEDVLSFMGWELK